MRTRSRRVRQRARTLSDRCTSHRTAPCAPSRLFAKRRPRSPSSRHDGTLSLCSENALRADTSVRVPYGVGPFTLVTGDLDRDSASEIVVCDSRHGLWVYTQKPGACAGMGSRAVGLAVGLFRFGDAGARIQDRSKLPVNYSPPMLVDLNRDGYLDIVVGGTNGLYAFNYKGVLIGGWPSYLDNRFWYQRGSVMASPIAVTGAGREPLVIFSSPTGERATFRVAKIDSASKNRGIVWFKNDAGVPDSLGGFPPGSSIPSSRSNDSLVAPYVTPGGFVDARQRQRQTPVCQQRAPAAGRSLQPLYQAGRSPPVHRPPLRRSPDSWTAPRHRPTFLPFQSTGWVYRWRLASADHARFPVLARVGYSTRPLVRLWRRSAAGTGDR